MISLPAGFSGSEFVADLVSVGKPILAVAALIAVYRVIKRVAGNVG